MSDSDSDGLLPNDANAFQNENTTVSVRGPNTNLNNITGISFRNNVFSSTLQMPRHCGRQRYAESSYDQRSMYRREISPMSVRSACDVRQRHYNHSFNSQGMGLPRSDFNGRSGSPVSIRSIDSSASVSAVVIANALLNDHFNKHEVKVIREAYNKFFKHQVSKKMNNRRYHKFHRRQRTGYDSGEQGSDSSLSSGDRSIRTSYKDNMSSCRSTMTDISNFRRKLKQSSLLKDRTDYYKSNFVQKAGSQINLNTTQTSIRSCRSISGSTMSTFRNMPIPAFHNNVQRKNPAPVMSQKERFTNGYPMPSQRFNRSGIPTSIPENVEKEHHTEMNLQNEQLTKDINSGRNIETDNEDIFSNANKQKPSHSRKRSIDCVDEDVFLPNQKRTTTLVPCKKSIEARELKASKDKANDFVFAKPSCPARKSVKEKLISKSAAPLLDIIPQASIVPPAIQQPTQEKPIEEEKDNFEYEQSNTTCNSTNISSRPSFTKRKLFTQKLVSEKINLSADTLNSPQNSMYGAIQKEKHKARKLQQATTQSCLRREIQQDESNLLDLINKIVPMDKMNKTNQTNKTESQSKNMTEEDDRWDLTSIISTHENYDNESDTFTDEEILNSTVKEQQVVSKKHSTKESENKVKNNITKKTSPAKPKSCKVLLEKLPTNITQSRIKNFWDTDFESDAEFQPSPGTNKLNSKENYRPDIMQPKEAPKTQGFSNIDSKKPTTAPIPSQNYTFDTTQKFNSTLRIRSHRAPKRKKLDQTTDEYAKTSIIESDSKKTQNQTSNSTKTCNTKPENQTKIKSKKSNEDVTKKNKSPKIIKQASRTDKQNQSVQKPNSQNQINNSTKTSNPEPGNETQKESKKPKETVTKKNKSPKIQKQVSKKDKQNQSVQKPNKQTQINNKNKDANEKGTKAKTTQQKLINFSKKQDEDIDAKTKNLSNAKKKEVDRRVPNNKNPKTKQATQRKNSPAIEENNNKSRTVRSCRAKSKNLTADKSNLALNETSNRTLRSRKLDLSSTSNKNYTKSIKKDTKNYMLLRLSDLSFSLAAEKNILPRRDVAKMTNSRLLNADESDVSFSLTQTPRKTRASNTRRNNTINSTPLRINTSLIKEPISNLRKRIPTKRYMY